MHCIFFFFNDTATTEIYTLSLHDALPILRQSPRDRGQLVERVRVRTLRGQTAADLAGMGSRRPRRRWPAVPLGRRGRSRGCQLRRLLERASPDHLRALARRTRPWPARRYAAPP